jgi:NTE family protein
MQEVLAMLNVIREQISPVEQQTKPLPYDVVALVLQCGGALGAYHAGVYEGLHEAGIRPNWLAGISIEALNAAIIAGSPEGERVQRLREFWETICTFSIEWPAGEGLVNALPFAFDINSVRNAMAGSRVLAAPSLQAATQRRQHHPEHREIRADACPLSRIRLRLL